MQAYLDGLSETALAKANLKKQLAKELSRISKKYSSSRMSINGRFQNLEREGFAPVKEDAAAVKISLNKSAVTLKTGRKYPLKASVYPADAGSSIAWTSSKKSVAVVSRQGVVTAKGAGTTTITAVTQNGKKAKCKVTVINPAKKVIISSREYLTKGKTKVLYATKLPADSKDKVIWRSSDKKVVTVNAKGKIKGIQAGTAIITAKTSSGKAASCKVTIVNKTAKAARVKLNKKSKTLSRGKTIQLKAVMNPAKATDRLTWKSSNVKVAKVDKNGVVTALKKGSARIIVKTSSGKTAACKIIVK